MELIAQPTKYISNTYSGNILPEYVFVDSYDYFLFFDHADILGSGGDESFVINFFEFSRSISPVGSTYIASLDEDYPSYPFKFDAKDDEESFMTAVNFPILPYPDKDDFSSEKTKLFYRQFDDAVLNNPNRIYLNSCGEGVGIFTNEPNDWAIYTNMLLGIGILGIKKQFLSLSLQHFGEIILKTKSAIYTQMKSAYHSSRYELFEEHFKRLCVVYKIDER